MTIRIRNDSTSAVVRGYAVDSHHTVIWLEMAPQHPKTIGAIWADLVQAQHPWLTLGDNDVVGSGLAVRGLGSRYERLAADAPELALGHNARPRFLRLIAPCSLKASEKEPFFTFPWPGMDAATALAAMLERDTRWPVQIGWGKYLLDAGLAEGFIKPLTNAGAAPLGYEVQPQAWGEIIAQGLKSRQITISK
jgi:hypothetical protein